MPFGASAETRIARPIAEVAAFVMDPENDSAWIGGIQSVTVLTPPPIAIGTRVERVAHFLGRELRYVNDVTALEPGASLEMRSHSAPFPMTVRYSFAENESSTTTTRVELEGDPGWFFRVAGPLLRLAVRRNLRGDLGRLKDLLEAASAPAP